MSLLAALDARARASDPLPRLHELARPAFTVLLSGNGDLQGVISHPQPARDEVPHLALVPRTARGRSSNLAPLLISDNGSYVLGRNDPKKPTQNGAQKHQAYLDLLKRAYDDTRHPALKAVLKATQALDIPDATHADAITFSVAGHSPHQDAALQRWWAAYQTGSETAGKRGTAPIGECAVSGQIGPLAMNTPKMSGVPGGQKSVNLLSLDGTAFRSHGRTDLGVSQSVAENASRELSRLCYSREHSFQPDAASKYRLLHWVSGLGDDPLTSLFTNAAAETLMSETLRSPGTGAATSTDAPGRLHLLTVTASGARVAVLGYRETSSEEASRNVRTFVERTQVITYDGQSLRASGLHALLGALGRQGQKGGAAAAQQDALLRCALDGTPLPASLLALCALHWGHDLALTPGRLSLVRLALCAQGVPMQPNAQDAATLPEHLRAGYLLGRYAALCERIHRAANPGVTLTVTDTYLRGLISSPQAIFPRMDAAVEVHLRAVARMHKVRAARLREELDTLLLGLDPAALPKVFTPPQQAALMLGLHHQRAAQRAELTRILEGRNAQAKQTG